MSKGKNALIVVGSALGGAAATAGIGLIVVNGLFGPENTANVNNQVKACASVLGKKAIDTTTIPEECTNYRERFDYNESFTVERNRPGADDDKTIRVRSYHLPTRADFIEANLITPEDERITKEQNEKFPLAMSPVGAFFGAALSAVALSAAKRT